MARPEGAVLRKVIQREDLPAPQNAWGPAWKIFYHHGAVSQEAACAPRPIGTRDGEAGPRRNFSASSSGTTPFGGHGHPGQRITATQVAARQEEPGVFLLRDPAAGPGPFQRPGLPRTPWASPRPSGGTAVHTVMQSIRLDRTGSAAAVAEELARLTQQAFLTPCPGPDGGSPGGGPLLVPAT